LYAVAHHAHFAQRDPAAALRAWDRYLAVHPRGRFAPEARYNRALMLIRLGRVPEAREALTPFAEGQLGGYRQREARELLGALDAGD
jgi:outer membrane protein assembly factor BamD (BamD/ComL family)